MKYIYDILLNFNHDFYEFYEWEKNDNFYHIKKIPVFYVDSTFIDDILTKNIKVDSNFLFNILNKTEIYDSKKNINLKYSCLFTDTYKIIGVLFDDSGKIVSLSDMLLDEAEDSINQINSNLTYVAYNILSNRKNSFFLTRREFKIKKYLKNEIDKIIKEKDYSKLRYIYLEFFGSLKDDVNLMYQDLLNSFSDITDKHVELYNLLNLCNRNKKNLLIKNSSLSSN